MHRGTNLGRLGDFNQAVIFESIRRALDGVSRVELAESTGLSPQTISNVVRRLLDNGLVREDRTTVSGPGKPRTVLELEVNSRLAVGIHLDPAVMTLVMLNLRGEVVARERHDMPSVENPTDTVKAMANAVESLIVGSGQPRSAVLGVGVAAPGPIDAERGIVVGPPLLEGWEQVELRQPLQEILGFKVMIDKDVTAAAVAESWSGGAPEARDFVFIYVGTGIGAGIVLHDQVVRGFSNNVGEIGHFSTGHHGQTCLCGKTDCIGMVMELSTIIGQAADAGLIEPIPQDASLAEKIDVFSQLTQSVQDGDERILKIVDTYAGILGTVVSQVANLLDVRRVVFGGPMWTLVGDFALPILSDIINRNFVVKEIHDVEVVSSRLGDEVGAIGGACLVLDKMLSPKASALLLG